MMAHKINPNGDVLYYLGNIAPDAVSDWKKKDLTHFRNLENRRDALDDLARKIDPTDSFAEGILMHLYLDWKWDLKDTLIYYDYLKKQTSLQHHEYCPLLYSEY